MRKDFKTPSRSSVLREVRRGCLCQDNKYSIKCCDGSLQAQGIGRTRGQVKGKSLITNRYIKNKPMNTLKSVFNKVSKIEKVELSDAEKSRIV
jgi:hypothetical protein